MINKQTYIQPSSIEDWVSEIKNGNITLLSKGITLLESKLKQDKEKADQILSYCSPYGSLSSLRIIFRIDFVLVIGTVVITLPDNLAVQFSNPEYK